MSLLKLSQFSYNRKERLLKDGKENHVSENRYMVENKLNLTPNKATMTATTIPETPDSLIAVSPNAEEPRHKESTTSFRQRQRRRHRLSSSSDEDDGASSASHNAPAVNGSCPKVLCNMFSGLPSSKRRKRTESNSEDQYICPRRAIPIQSNVGEKLREYEFDESISDIKLKPHSKALRNGYSKDKLHSKDLQQLCELFPQHGQGYLKAVLVECNSVVNDAVSLLLASSEKRSMYKSHVVCVDTICVCVPYCL